MTEKNAVKLGEKIQVLVVDDSKVMRRAITKILGNDADIMEAENGEAGWQAIVDNEQIQVLITDIEMPELDGYQLICRIRASEENRIRNLPIITITGAEDEETKSRAFACGATDFIVKPLDKVQLQARVQAHAKLDETSRQLEETTTALEEEATTDPLTQLASRRYFLQRCNQDMAHALRHNNELTLMRIDIDQFKKLYQTHGDDIADKILIYIAKNLAATARKEDTVARVGGAEFAVIAPSTSKAEATILAERMCAAVKSQPFNAGDSNVPLSLSIGVVTLGPDKVKTLEDLISLADNRLRHAKAEGGNLVSASARNEDAASETVEVTLNAPETIDEPENIDIGITLDSIDDEVEFEVDDDLAAAAASRAAKEDRGAPPLPTGLPVELVNINQILDMLSNGDANKISPYLLDLSLRVLPLLEQCDRHYNLGLSSALDSIKERMFGLK